MVGGFAEQVKARSARPRIAGAYMIPAFGRYDVVAEVLEGMVVGSPAEQA